jgi:hypothetical protein
MGNQDTAHEAQKPANPSSTQQATAALEKNAAQALADAVSPAVKK